VRDGHHRDVHARASTTADVAIAPCDVVELDAKRRGFLALERTRLIH
jgi:hypothetical protein